MKTNFFFLFFTIFLVGCTEPISYKPNSKTHDPKSIFSDDNPMHRTHKKSRTDSEQRAVNDSVHEQQRAIMRGEQGDHSIINRY
ncbi:Uncharacterised protein [Providencia heimbachae]|uniref:Lipoprotein n=1 Tax=Providencia heimbachae ATCC 35613 TaxID=1354272 RepID=A0A1B7JI03_9GAMM|nr:hypothetical protein M998_3692 [Providencia heimbachae ATCC 35613]SQH12902.1 Uncharacterised protein [Providencia heimbachae]